MKKEDGRIIDQVESENAEEIHFAAIFMHVKRSPLFPFIEPKLGLLSLGGLILVGESPFFCFGRILLR